MRIINQKLSVYYEKVEIRTKGIGARYRLFACYVIAAMLEDDNKDSSLASTVRSTNLAATSLSFDFLGIHCKPCILLSACLIFVVLTVYYLLLNIYVSTIISNWCKKLWRSYCNFNLFTNAVNEFNKCVWLPWKLLLSEDHQGNMLKFLFYRKRYRNWILNQESFVYYGWIKKSRSKSKLRTRSFGTIPEWEYTELVVIVFFWDLFWFRNEPE